MEILPVISLSVSPSGLVRHAAGWGEDGVGHEHRQQIPNTEGLKRLQKTFCWAAFKSDLKTVSHLLSPAWASPSCWSLKKPASGTWTSIHTSFTPARSKSSAWCVSVLLCVAETSAVWPAPESCTGSWARSPSTSTRTACSSTASCSGRSWRGQWAGEVVSLSCLCASFTNLLILLKEADQ